MRQILSLCLAALAGAVLGGALALIVAYFVREVGWLLRPKQRAEVVQPDGSSRVIKSRGRK